MHIGNAVTMTCTVHSYDDLLDSEKPSLGWVRVRNDHFLSQRQDKRYAFLFQFYDTIEYDLESFATMFITGRGWY